MQSGILYIVATPIGNLEDITYRAIKALHEVDLIVCEDTRNTKRLLERYEVKTPANCFYSGGGGGSVKPRIKYDFIVDELKSGKNLALVTDAGTPGVSDPGNQLVEKAIEEGIVVIPVPGASALTTLISVSGIDMQKFVFLGFPPHKKGRETFFKEVAGFKIPVGYYESPHRVIKNLELLKTFAPEKRVVLGRELTKMFEEIVRGTIQETLDYFEDNKNKIKGEFVIIVY